MSNSAGKKEGINQGRVSAATKRRLRLRTTRNIKTTELAGEIRYLGTYLHLPQATDLGACNFWWGFLPSRWYPWPSWHLNFVGRSTIGCVTYKPPLCACQHVIIKHQLTNSGAHEADMTSWYSDFIMQGLFIICTCSEMLITVESLFKSRQTKPEQTLMSTLNILSFI